MIEKLLSIAGKEYDWNEKMKEVTGKTGTEYGVIAQEVQKQFPEMVKEGPNGYLMVVYIRFIPIIIESIRELKEEIDSLKANK